MHESLVYSYAAIERLRPILDTPAEQWLSPGEQRALGRLYDGSRRQTWLSGRLLAKRLIAYRLAQTVARSEASHAVGCAYCDIDVRSDGRPPKIFVHGRPLRWSLSITHTRRSVLAALCCIPGVSVGVDLAELRDLGPVFARTWFTTAERRWLSGANPLGHAIVWAAKEAAYKATGRGQRFDPRLIEVLPAEDGYVARLRGDRTNRPCWLSVWQTPHDEIAIFAVDRGATRSTFAPASGRDFLTSQDRRAPEGRRWLCQCGPRLRSTTSFRLNPAKALARPVAATGNSGGVEKYSRFGARP